MMKKVNLKYMFFTKSKFILAFLFAALTYNSFAQDGKALFKANCASCHAPTDKRVLGPGLKGFWDRIPGGDDEGKKKWYINWVKNASSIIGSKSDPYVNKLYAEYGSPMNSQGHLKDEEIMAIADYVKNYAEPVAAAGGEVKANPFAPVAEPDITSTYLWLTVAFLALLILVSALLTVKRALQEVNAAKTGVTLDPQKSFIQSVGHWILTHKLQVGLILILLGAIYSTKWYIDAADNIGVYQGYKPEQPIQFSHAIHAGDNKIACVYCHHSAEKGKNAGIPSVNICMNCHKGIQEGTWTGTSEISKIYDAAGYNPQTGKYENPEKPIRWVRVHNLPDLAYFNHSQHVVAGQVECQTCHGKVEEMHVLEQHSDLTMGWCINCHRETEVKMEGNAYYTKMFDELVKKHKGKVNSFTVEDIGGLECSKCHY